MAKDGFSSMPVGRRRVSNPDGTVNIFCRLCGCFIKRSVYQGFSSATCIECLEGKTPVDRIEQEDDSVVSLYTEAEMATVRTEDKAGFVRTIFRAMGLPLPPRKVPKKSATIAKAKQRKPLFGPREDKILAKEEDDDE